MVDDNNILDQLSQWKTKYFDAIDELEQQKSYDELLERSLARLALAAQGLDPLLDKQLHSLRNILRRHGKIEQDEIKKILQKMEKVIVHMEQPKDENNNPDISEILASFLKSLNLPSPFKSEANTLIAQLKKSSNNELSTILPKLSALFDSYINQQKQTETSSSFGFNLFGSNKETETSEKASDHEGNRSSTELVASTAEKERDSNTNTNTNTENITPLPVHLVLIQFLEQLSLPAQLSKKATLIRHNIQDGITKEQLPSVINDISDIIHTINKQMVSEKREYEMYLKALASKLSQLVQRMKTGNEESVAAFQSRQAIGSSLKNTFNTIKNDVGKSHDLGQLRTKLESTLDSLEGHFENYQQSDTTQFEQAQAQISQLKQQISAMEQESIKLRQNAMKSRDLALKDPLTQLWNRQALNENLEKEFNSWQRYKRPLSIVLWDLDHFKSINDTYGHAAGDKVLKTVAQLFLSLTRATDSIARYGGEEFMGIFPETGLEEAELLANKIREHIRESKFHYEGDSVQVTVSAGIAQFGHEDTIKDVLKRADEALYRAKAQGRNCCVLGG